MEEFGKLLDLPHEDKLTELGDRGNRYNYITVAFSLIRMPLSGIPYPFTARYILPESRMNDRVMTYILFLRQGNFGLLTQIDLEIVCLIEKK